MMLSCASACRSVSGIRRRTWMRKGNKMNIQKKTTIFDGCRSVRSALAKTARLCLGLNQTDRDKQFVVFFESAMAVMMKTMMSMMSLVMRT